MCLLIFFCFPLIIARCSAESHFQILKWQRQSHLFTEKWCPWAGLTKTHANFWWNIPKDMQNRGGETHFYYFDLKHVNEIIRDSRKRRLSLLATINPCGWSQALSPFKCNLILSTKLASMPNLKMQGNSWPFAWHHLGETITQSGPRAKPIFDRWIGFHWN